MLQGTALTALEEGSAAPVPEASGTGERGARRAEGGRGGPVFGTAAAAVA